MISRSFSSNYPIFNAECDNCGDSLPYVFESFEEAVDELRKLGWRRHKGPDGQWENICPDCQDLESRRRYENGRSR